MEYKPADSKAIAHLFTVNKEGVKVLEMLALTFYDIASYTPNDPYATAYHEGQRSVVRFILDEIHKAQQGVH